MIDRVTIWNKTGVELEARIKLIITYADIHLYDENAETFLAWKAKEKDRELVIELEQIGEEEEE